MDSRDSVNFIKCFSGRWKPQRNVREGKKGQRHPSRTFHVKDLQDHMMDVLHFTVEKPTTNTNLNYVDFESFFYDFFTL